MPRRRDCPIERCEVSVFVVPTSSPEADGTFRWQATTLVVVEVAAGGVRGLGYTYADTATATLIRDTLTAVVLEQDALATGAAWEAMRRAIRNLGRPGIASMAIAAVDSALWDLKARVLGLSLVDLLGPVREMVPVYGSGGFTNYSDDDLAAQLGGWADQGMRRVKMKVGRDGAADRRRVRLARSVIGDDVELFVDANGAWAAHEALAHAEAFARSGVTWFEEPVSSDDLDGLSWMRLRAPAGMAITAGEYGYDLPYFRRMLAAGAVDVLQADATRCAGLTGFMQAAVLCEAHNVALSAHTAPALHAAVGCALERVIHVEYFHDHARIEGRLFEGVPALVDGALRPDRSRPGLGLTLRRREAERFAA